MPGNTAVHADVFGALFERHLGEVFATAWQVVRDREVAAEIARDTFADAWGEHLPEGDVPEWLYDRARARARDWLGESGAPVALAVARPEPPPHIGPVLRARIVTALEVRGVPTRVPAPQPTPPPPAPDLGPPEGRATNPATRLAAAAVLAVVVLGLAAVMVLGGGSDGEGDDAADERKPSARQPERGDDSGSTTSTAAPGSTTTVPAPSTTVASSAGDGRPATSAVPPTRPPPPAATVPPAPPPTESPGPAPNILVFWGVYVGGDEQCSGGERMLSMWWNTANTTGVSVWPEGGSPEGVAVPLGTHGACTWPGTRWYLRATGPGGTHETSFVNYPG